MRIGLDATYSVGSQLTGIGVYSAKLLDELPRLHPSDQFLYCYRPKQFFRAARRTATNARRRILQPPFPTFRADVFHALNQRADQRPARRVVATFHDLFVMTSEYYSSPEFRERFTRQAHLAASHSDLIIAVSHFTAAQVQELLHVEPSRIRVIPHGVDIPPQPDGTLREKLILFVGALQVRKNISRMISAFEQLPGDWRLVLAGSPCGFGAEEIMERIRKSPASARIEVAGHVGDAELAQLYRTASIFTFPSLDEGFGIPVLEAMAHGVPVVTSNRSALPEVAGDAALIVDPYDSDAIARGLQRLASEPTLWQELSAKGVRRASEFSWNKAVEATYNVYRELADR